MAGVFMANGQLNCHREGMRVLLKQLIAGLCGEPPELITGLEIRLFQNDYQPTCTDEVADYEEADFTGYNPAEVLADACGGFIQFGINEAGFPTLYLDQQTFKATGAAVGNTIYGVYIVALYATEPELLLASLRFENGPFAVVATDDAVKVSGDMPLECQMAPVV